jgi:hypothetical protein
MTYKTADNQLAGLIDYTFNYLIHGRDFARGVVRVRTKDGRRWTKAVKTPTKSLHVRHIPVIYYGKTIDHIELGGDK